MTKNKGINAEQVLTIVFVICVFILGIINIEDTDTWTHLSFGRYIVEHKGLPEKEPFVYPSINTPSYIPSWLFGIIFYFAYALFNIYGVILLKAVIITAIFYVLWKDSLLPGRNYIASIIVLTFIIFMVRHRFVERPDIALMLFLSFTIFALNSFVLENKKYIYFLPLTQLLWVNMHPSIILVVVPFAAFISGGLIQRFIGDKLKVNLPLTPSAKQLKIIGLVFFTVLAVSFINPYLARPFYAPFELTSADWWKDEIMELQPPTWEYHKSPFLLTAAIIVSFLISIRKPSLIHLFLVIPFVYLAFTGLRFIFLLGIIGGPVIVRNIASELTIRGPSFTVKRFSFSRKLLEGLLVIGLLILTALAVYGVKPFSTGKIFGFGVDYDYFPEGALRYLDKRKITGHVFNTFQWGGYITWRDFPKRTVFVDGRGCLSNDLLEKLDLARTRPWVLDVLQRNYNFNVSIINYPVPGETPVGETLHDTDLALSSKDWALVYWDDLAMVYLKRGEELKDIIGQDEYRYIKPANGASSLRSKLHDKEYLFNIITGLKRNINDTDSSIGYSFLGFVYNETGRYKEAIEALSQVRDYPVFSNLFSAYQGMAFAYGHLGFLDKSLEYYKKAQELKKDASVMYNIGIAYIRKGDKEKAVKYFESALNLNKNLLSIYPYLISIYQKLGKLDKADKTEKAYESARSYGQGEEHFQKGLKAYVEQKYESAVEEFKQSITANPSNPASYSNLGYVYYDIGLTSESYEYQRRAIDIDPEFANAHYGLAMIYKKLGDREGAMKHWEEYLRIEPKGYFSRKAKEELTGF